MIFWLQCDLNYARYLLKQEDVRWAQESKFCCTTIFSILIADKRISKNMMLIGCISVV
jgi:hypothetical protein